MHNVEKNIALIKGIHPGLILARELKRRNLSKRYLSLLINEYPQLIGDITNCKRRINPSLSIRLGNTLGFDESFFSVLQTFFDLEQEKKKKSLKLNPDIKIFRPVLFWDTDISTINWQKSKNSVIKRVFELGNSREIKEIIRFYGEENVRASLNKIENMSTRAKKNIETCLSN